MSRPFDEARYRGMLEGLEVAEVSQSKVSTGVETLRFDPEYFQKQHLADEKLVVERASYFTKFAGLGLKVDASAFYPSIEDYYDQGDLPFLRVADVDSMIDFQACTRIPAELCSWFSTLSRVKPGDIVLTKGGSVARIGLVTEEAAVSRDLIFLNSSQLPEADRVLLYLYFQSGFFNRALIRSSSQTAQPHLTITLVRQLPIFIAGNELKQACLRLVQMSFQARSESLRLAGEAEQTLLRALGLENWQPPEPLTYTRPSREAFAAGRLDAEYFSPATHAILDLLATHEDIALGDIYRVSTGFPWLSDQFIERQTGAGEPFVRIRDCKPGAIWAEDLDMLYPSYANEQGQTKAKPGDLVVGMDGLKWFYASLLMNECYINQRVTWLIPNNDDYPAEYLLIAINSLLGQRQLLSRMTIASTVGHITLEDLRGLRIPVLNQRIRKEIAVQVREAILGRQQATQLLEAARLAVEIAIEQSEAAALAWLEKTVAALNEPVASVPAPCEHRPTPEPNHDPQTTPTSGTTPEDLARNAPGRGKPARGVSPAGAGLHAELDGAGTGAGGAGAPGIPAQTVGDSTRPLDATRELATAAGSLTYTEVSERLAVNIVHCLDDVLDANPEDIAITPDWIRGIHSRLAGELFPEWGGRFRVTDVQVGTHLPPPANAVAVEISNFCLDLTERLRHLSNAESIAELLAWVDWRFQWIHPFKDFNGRVGRILLVALTYKLGLPPIDPVNLEDKDVYFAALRAADAGDPTRLRELWLDRLGINPGNSR